MTIAIGDTLPSATLHEKNPKDEVTTEALFGTGRTLLFGVPGAFTPGCSKTHLPGYIAQRDALTAKGIDQVFCIAVNDAHVMREWGQISGATGKVRMLADTQANFVTAMGLNVQTGPILGGMRSKRFAMVIDGGTVTHLQVEPDGFGLTCSLAESLIDQL